MLNYSHTQGTTKLAIKIDENTLKVLRFMQDNFTASKLVAISELVAKMAPILWGHFDREEISPTLINYELTDKKLTCGDD